MDNLKFNYKIFNIDDIFIVNNGLFKQIDKKISEWNSLLMFLPAGSH